MKIFENVILYKCDFCNKKLQRKHAMENHERKCGYNPENNRPCLNGCQYMETREIEYDSGMSDYRDGEPIYKKGTTFFCNKFGKYMLHPKVENEAGLKWVYSENNEVEQESMPKECDRFTNGFDNFEDLWKI